MGAGRPESQATDAVEFGQWVKRRRHELLLTQEVLAARAQVSIRTLQMLESGGGRPPRASTRRQLADVLGQPTPAPTPAPEPVPAQLPWEVRAFTGRAVELSRLDDYFAQAGSASGAAPLVVISGMAGIGKTALSIRWASRMAADFPDGQLYVDLRGYDSAQPMAPADVLAGFLRAFGVCASELPRGLAELTSRYRTLLATRRVLVVLDNAGSDEQVRPLLPGGRSCFVLVTSRSSLAGLVAREGARRLAVGALPDADAVALLRAIIDGSDPATAAALAERCARLPLALRIAGEWAVGRDATALRTLVDGLGDERRRLDLLNAGGDPRTAVRSVFSWSFRHLPAPAARMFTLLGLHPGGDFDAYAAAALADVDIGQARELLDVLVRAHLVAEPYPDRFTLHDLLRVYAAERARTEPPPAPRQAAGRLLAYYLGVAAACMDVLFPIDRPPRPNVAPVAGPAPWVRDRERARAWLEQELTNLLAAGTYAAREGWPVHTVQLAAVLWRYLDSSGYWPQALVLHARAWSAARQIHDRRAEATALHNLGLVHWRFGNAAAALRRYRRALALWRESADPTGAARTLNNLGGVMWQLGDYGAAIEHIGQAVHLHHDTGERMNEATATANLGAINSQLGHYAAALQHLERAAGLLRDDEHPTAQAILLDNLGIVSRRQGRYNEADRYHRASLVLARRLGDRYAEANALDNLGILHVVTGRIGEAAGFHDAALAVCTQIGNRAGEAEAIDNLGIVSRLQGRLSEAIDRHRRALDILAELTDRRRLPRIRNGLGEALLAAGAYDEALVQHRAALELSRECDGRHEHARALDGMAAALCELGDRRRAVRLWREALELYTAMGVPEAATVRDRLGAVSLAEPDSGAEHGERVTGGAADRRP